jgi:hypothetical protein
MYRCLKIATSIACVAAMTIGCGRKSSPTGPSSTGGSSIPTVQTITIGGGGSGTSALTVGQTRQLKASARLSDGSEYDITLLATWSSDNGDVATVTPAGLVTAMGAGTGRIQASYQQATGVTTFDIAEDQSSTGSGPSAPSTNSGTTPDTGGTPPPPPGSPSPAPGPGVPPAPPPGNGGPDTPVPGVPGGPAVPGLPSTPPTVQSITITGDHNVPVGRNAQFHAIANMSDGSQKDVTGSSQWSTDNSMIAGISQNGLLTALFPDSNVARANYNGTTASQPFTVTPF